MRKLFNLVLALVLVLPLFLVQASETVQAATGPLLFVNGEPVTTDVAAFIENGRTMVPVKFVADQLGYKNGTALRKKLR
ncbi:MAG: hypothetical protein IMX04_05515 [Candidatus Carbobacillus altaicus]|nr:hypothetical protein [Candidatus Carbobacillus altaicus]